MTSAAVLSIVNRSLLSVGARAQVQSLQEVSTEAQAASVLFTPTFQQLARSAPWNCLRKQAVLSLLAAAQGTPENPTGIPPLPPQPWLYQYALPSDSLQVRFLIPTFPNPQVGNVPPTTASISADGTYFGNGQIPYEVAYATDVNNNPIQVILTNLSQAQAVYTVDAPFPEIWDSLFQAAMVASLAAYFVPALSLNMPLMQASIKSAEAMIAQARVRDGNESVITQNREADWMRARTSGHGLRLGWGQNGYQQYGGYSSMGWPGA